MKSAHTACVYSSTQTHTHTHAHTHMHTHTCSHRNTLHHTTKRTHTHTQCLCTVFVGGESHYVCDELWHVVLPQCLYEGNLITFVMRCDVLCYISVFMGRISLLLWWFVMCCIPRPITTITTQDSSDELYSIKGQFHYFWMRFPPHTHSFPFPHTNFPHTHTVWPLVPSLMFCMSGTSLLLMSCSIKGDTQYFWMEFPSHTHSRLSRSIFDVLYEGNIITFDENPFWSNKWDKSECVRDILETKSECVRETRSVCERDVSVCLCVCVCVWKGEREREREREKVRMQILVRTTWICTISHVLVEIDKFEIDKFDISATWLIEKQGAKKEFF